MAIDLTSAYRTTLRAHLALGRHGDPAAAHRLGRRAVAAGLSTLDLAKIHERVLLASLLPKCRAAERAALIRKAATFFGLVMIPGDVGGRGERTAIGRLKRSIAALGQRTVELAASNLELSQEVAQRAAAEEALRVSERRFVQLLDQSDLQQAQLRRLSRQILVAQEDERKHISRDLHDVVAQTLTGINIRLAELKMTAQIGSKDLERNITRTQRLVLKSVEIVHRFARELRPAVLDDLGLIPALHSVLKGIAKRSAFRAQLNAVAEVETLDASRRAVLFRVAQEALINVARHAQAGNVEVSITKTAAGFRLVIRDDGRSFVVGRIFASPATARLGLIGMRERLEMVGGRLTVVSTPGEGTTVTADMPLAKSGRRARATTGAGP